ncbi:dockerin type I domain-containing protein [bacterium]|nr:dockerin type I domain-containing protein [bacterium]
MRLKACLFPVLLAAFLFPAAGLLAEDVFPAAESLAPVRPRLLIRGDDSTCGVPLSRLRTDTTAAEYRAMRDRLRQQTSPACYALQWQMYGDSAMADSAVAALKRYRYATPGNTFGIYSTLFENGLAYDWVHDYVKFSAEDRAAVRAQFYKLAYTDGLALSGDHIFHNYVWMSACGSAIWALATAGEDSDSDKLYTQVRAWLNNHLYPGMHYMDGLPGESLGYWSQYDFTGAVWTVLAAQSASGQNLVGRIATEQDDWLRRQYMNEIHSVQPDMRFLPWGDVIGGPNGSVTHEMAGVLDACAWAFGSGEGAWFDRWLAGKRGAGRFYGLTSMYYMLYTKHLSAAPVTPALSYTAGGGAQGGHFIARGAWEDGATLVGFGVKDHYGDHNHYDQGGFTLYRNGFLVADPTVYNEVNGPQQPADVHSTLILYKPGSTFPIKQREPHGQNFGSLDNFKANLDAGQMLNTGDFLFSAEGGGWAAAAGQYAQAYQSGVVKSCVRQILFLRPSTLLVVDQLQAAAAGSLSGIDWLLQLAAQPNVNGSGLFCANAASWLRCRTLYPDTVAPAVQATSVGTWRASYHFTAGDNTVLVHCLETGDGAVAPDSLPGIVLSLGADSLRIETADWVFSLARSGTFGVSGMKKKPPVQPGDMNGDSKLDVFDLLGLLKALGGGTAAGAESDVNGDGRMDIFDLLALLKKLAG